MPNQRSQKINKRLIETLMPSQKEYSRWDSSLPGFGVRVRPSGAMSYFFFYRVGGGRAGPQKRYTIGNVQKITPEQARAQAKSLAGDVAQGRDPSAQRTSAHKAITVSALADRFMNEHVESKRKASTTAFYRDIIERILKPKLGANKADKVTRAEIAKLHHQLRDTPFQANRVLAVIGSMYTFADRMGLVAEGFNPTQKIERNKENSRERFLTAEELLKLGSALKDAETIGLPWSADETKPTAKHLPKTQRTVVNPYAIAAIRLLIFTGARLREILHLRWDEVDLQRRLLLLPDSKTGKKAIVLNAPACLVLNSLPRVGSYVIVGNDPEKPRADLQRPWKIVSKHAGLPGVRIHDLRHTHASVAAAAGFSLPIIGKLLGHTQASTTERYAHLNAGPLHHASENIGKRLAADLGHADPTTVSPILPFKRSGSI